MNRIEAFTAMKGGHKIAHSFFASNEYYELKGNKVIAEDGVNHTDIFWSTADNNWRKDGWLIYNEIK